MEILPGLRQAANAARGTMKGKEMKTEYKHICFEEIQTGTRRFIVKNGATGLALGRIMWHWQGRKYCFFASFSGFTFDAGCLVEIHGFMEELMSERNKGVKE